MHYRQYYRHFLTRRAYRHNADRPNSASIVWRRGILHSPIIAVWLLLVGLCFHSSLSLAQTTQWISSPEQPSAKVRLLFSGEIDSSTRQVYAGLQVQLDSPWKTYWRSPGEAGIAPSLTWRSATNLVSTDWRWPTPERFDLLGIQTLGYQGNVTFPLLLTVGDTEQPVELSGVLRLSTCTTVCLLTDYPIDLSFIPANLNNDHEAAFLIDKALSQVPGPSNGSGLSVDSVGWDAQDQSLIIGATSIEDWQHTDVILDGPEDVSFSLPELRFSGNQLQAIVKASHWIGPVDLEQQNVNVTLVNDQQAIEVTMRVQPFAGELTTHTSSSLLMMVLFGLLGGLILNLMPCVLPVLGIKLSSIIQATGQSNRSIRWQFLSSAAGILVSFWLLALFLFIVKWTGNQVGWGIQFQNPWFIGFMSLMTGAFAANLLGAFEIQLPSSLNTKLANTGSHSLSGHFVQGMFATLLATPCSAPFLGTAVAFALTTGTANLFAIFTSMGIGLALPYLLVATFPRIIASLPKPGLWMITLRRILGILLIMTTLWLLHLLSTHLNAGWMLALVFLVLAYFIAMLLPDRFKQQWLFRSAVSLSLAALLTTSWHLFIADNTRFSNTSTLDWQPLDAEKIPQLVADGKTVFVDVTADWCITCKANKIRVLDRDSITLALDSDQVVLMQGDWTTPSPAVNHYLKHNKRFGVPFNMVYGPAVPDGIALPVILDHDSVMQALTTSQATNGS